MIFRTKFMGQKRISGSPIFANRKTEWQKSAFYPPHQPRTSCISMSKPVFFDDYPPLFMKVKPHIQPSPVHPLDDRWLIQTNNPYWESWLSLILECAIWLPTKTYEARQDLVIIAGCFTLIIAIITILTNIAMITIRYYQNMILLSSSLLLIIIIIVLSSRYYYHFIL